MDDQDESSPIESRYEVRDSESSEETTDYDNALEEILEDIVDMLQTHPELLKELMNSKFTVFSVCSVRLVVFLGNS